MSPGDYGLRLIDAGLHYGKQIALQGINLRVEHGERLAIIGPSGAGKTSLLRLLATQMPPSSGQLELLGRQPWALPARQRKALRSQLGLIQHSPPLPPRQRVVTAVMAGRTTITPGPGPLASGTTLPISRRSSSKIILIRFLL